MIVSIFRELQRRNVFRVGTAYAVVSWLLIQVAETIFPLFGFDDTPARVVVIVLAIGFVPALVLAWAFEWTPAGPQRDRSPGPEAAAPRSSGRRLDRVIMVALALAVGFFAFDRFVLDPRRDADLQRAAEERGRSSALREAVGDRSIAVLPFADLSPGGDQAYISEGVAEEILNLLARVKELRVISRSSSFRYRGDVDIPTVANELGVAYVLEGAARRLGDRVRITAQMIDAQTDAYVWSESFDRTLDDIFSVQEEIAAAVVEALQINLIGEPPRQRVTDSENYARYLEALYFFNRSTREGRVEAIARLQDVLAEDPGYAPALSLLAGIYAYQSNSGERDFDEGFALARQTALEALAIDPELADGWGVLAYIQSYYDWDWAAAGRSVERMLELESATGFSQHVAATYMNMLGRFERSLELRDEAIRLDPLASYYRTARAFTLMSVGRFDEAEATLRELLEFYPDAVLVYRQLAKIRLLEDKPERALALLSEHDIHGMQAEGLRAMALSRLGRTAEAEAIFEQASNQRAPGWSFYLAHFRAYNGDADRAFEALQDAVQHRYRVLAYILGEPLLYPLHDDPRWRAILDGIGLLEYWEQVPAEYGGPAP